MRAEDPPPQKNSGLFFLKLNDNFFFFINLTFSLLQFTFVEYLFLEFRNIFNDILH